MNLILRTYSSNPEYNGDCDYALIKLYKPQIHQIKNRMKLANSLHNRDTSFICLEYWDPTPRFFSLFENLERLVDCNALNEGGLVHMGDNLINRIPEAAYQDTEASKIIVFLDSMYWECRPRHCEVLIETAEVSKAVLVGGGL
ncbi:hypothetical protein HYS94_05735 [Candidatus Daviesbacteria bacterium]|nr:hypothetical protein [Candidatus Daviesbacteria bacterium]